MKSNVIAFDRNRKAAAATVRPATTDAPRDNVVSLAGWKARSHARRTASGVFFTTGVLATCGSVA